MRKPVLAAINGHAIGMGLTYPLQCDVRFVASDAKLSFAFTRRGVAPELGSHFLLPRIVGFSNAADLLLSGRTFTGEDAARNGLASRALPADEVLPATLAYAHELATACSPTACAVVKELLWSALDRDHADTRRVEGKLFGWLAQRDDAREGSPRGASVEHPDGPVARPTDRRGGTARAELQAPRRAASVSPSRTTAFRRLGRTSSVSSVLLIPDPSDSDAALRSARVRPSPGGAAWPDLAPRVPDAAGAATVAHRAPDGSTTQAGRRLGRC